MAIFHCQAKSISRSAGRSATAAAAYRAGVCLKDERTGDVHDYSQKKGVEYSEIITPDDSTIKRERLWNAAESAEKRKDAKVAREWELALPKELNEKERIEVARNFAKAVCVIYGVAADLCIHAPGKDGDQRNYHAHILTTTRIYQNGQLGEKTRVLDSPKTSGKEIESMRKVWADIANQALEKAGHKVRIDSRSLKKQGIDREPTRHMGPTATAMERRGIRTERGDLNRFNENQEQNERKELANLEREQQGIQNARKRFYKEKVDRAVAKEEAEKREQQRKQQEAEREKEREALEKQYGRAIRMIVSPNSPETAHVCSEYGKYLDKLQAATSEKRAEMVKELQKAEDSYNIRCNAGQLFYSYAKVVSDDTTIAGWERVRDTMLKEWDRSTPEMRKQMEWEVKEYVRTHEHQRGLER